MGLFNIVRPLFHPKDAQNIDARLSKEWLDAFERFKFKLGNNSEYQRTVLRNERFSLAHQNNIAHELFELSDGDIEKVNHQMVWEVLSDD